MVVRWRVLLVLLPLALVLPACRDKARRPAPTATAAMPSLMVGMVRCFRKLLPPSSGRRPETFTVSKRS